MQSYKKVWDYQEDLMQKKVKEKSNTSFDGESTPDYLILLEHHPVITLGKNGNENNMLLAMAELPSKGIEYFHINRGGDITYHGPGQITGYPVLDLDHFKTDLGWYVFGLEEMMIRTLAEYGLPAERSKGETGVWLDVGNVFKARKIGAIGVKCSRWVTIHGFAFNVNTDLNYFNFIVPCGIKNKQVTSLEKELGHKVDINEVKQKLVHHFEEYFDAVVTSELATVAL